MVPSGHFATSITLSRLSAMLPGPGGFLLAFGLGVLQHAVLDYLMPEFKFNVFSKKEIAENKDFIVAEGAVSVASLAHVPDAYAWAAVAGYLATELPDAFLSVLNRKRWMEGRHLMPWHRKQKGHTEVPWPWTVTVGVSFLLLLLQLWVV